MESLVVTRAGGGERLWEVEAANSWLGRLRGLIGRADLPAGGGLFLPGTNSVHMLFMRFAIDCVFVGPVEGDERSVMAVRPNLRPWTGVVWWVSGARGVLEVPAGSAAEAGIAVGDRLVLKSPA